MAFCAKLTYRHAPATTSTSGRCFEGERRSLRYSYCGFNVAAAVSSERRSNPANTTKFAGSGLQTELNVSLKKARKLQKKAAKQRRGLCKLVHDLPSEDPALEAAITSLKDLELQLVKRIIDLEVQEEAEECSSSSDSEDEARPRKVSNTVSFPAVEIGGDPYLQYEGSGQPGAKQGKPEISWHSPCAGAAGVAQSRVFVCQGKKCLKSGAAQVLSAVNRAATQGDSSITVTACGCLGKCKDGPVVRVKPPGGRSELFTQVAESDIEALVSGKIDRGAAAESAA
uniref:Uncharacterized protein n=1 Tax=Tetraselmis sp. GSL018 TaxID=582737 RepID=A0A061R4C2_9CHLO|mmetsp:Transcript_40863/g.97136  ORF Transcript_40863/g.97136 Transcript_40863/m.97136 type:complete len:284 (+) Transcript_40863:289-1140(+)|eukprot:CAMPEP_0177603950 /NCGR_PEP_ID=MMETSP0419_2-20121207/15824_1 /TAXON_ID=582737 /ORGANISM="Tetraselmis sp., Strain GSL018" /LENGTH=283 /DNA_ID=CAMNT_0019097833 /DNA_START=241 /DNA_END=1092 /DNA_ORIENTATION=+